MINLDNNKVPTLNDNIIVRFQFAAMEGDTNATYSIYTFDENTGTYSSEPIFNGYVFIQEGQTYLDLDLGDILADEKYNFNFLKVDEYYNRIVNANGRTNGWYNRYKVVLDIDGGSGLIIYPEVCLCHEYPTKDLFGTDNKIPEIDSSEKYNFPFMQGYEYNSGMPTFKLLPTYPYVLTDNFGFGYTYYVTKENLNERQADSIYFAQGMGGIFLNRFTEAGFNYKYWELSEFLANVQPTYKNGWIKLPYFVKKTDTEYRTIDAEMNLPLYDYGKTIVVDGLTYNLFTGDGYSFYMSTLSNIAGNEVFYIESIENPVILDEYHIKSETTQVEHTNFLYAIDLELEAGYTDVERLKDLEGFNAYLKENWDSWSERKQDEFAGLMDSMFQPYSYDGILNEVGYAYGALRGSNGKIAKFETCLSDYYLMWVDRTGGIQCQPFKNVATMRLNYNDTTATNMRGYKRLIGQKNSLKWTINTDWINEELYPYYESIYTSPILVLYDVKNDKSFNVLVTDTEYVEKTMKNQAGKLFSLTLNIENNKEERHIW